MQRSNKKWFLRFMTTIMLVSLLVTGCSKEDITPQKKEQKASEYQPLKTNSKKVVAEFNGKKITEGELNLYTNITAFIDPNVAQILTVTKDKKQLKELKTILLKGYATEVQLTEKVKKEKEFQKQASEQMKTMDSSMANPQDKKSPKNLAEAIKGKGFTKAQLKEYMKRNLQRNAYFEKQLKGAKYTHVKLQHVLVATASPTGQEKRSDAEAKKRAEEVKKKWEQGGNIKKLAKEYSDDTGSKDKSGEIEGPTDLFVTEFAKKADTIELNKISTPVKTQYGYHVLKVLEREEKPLDKKVPEYDMITQKKLQDLNQEYIEKEIKLKIML